MFSVFLWYQEKKGATEDEMVAWHHRLNGHEFEQTPGDGEGQGSPACCNPWGHKELDMTEHQQNKNMIFPLSLHRFKWGSLWRGQIHRLQSKLKDSGPPETVPSWGWEVAGALGSHACGQCPHHGISNAHTCPSPGCPLTWRSASVLPSFPTKMVFATSCHSYEIQGVMRWGGKPGNYVGSTPASLVPSLWQQLAHPCTLAGTWVRAVACVVVTSVTKWPEQELNY